MSIELEKGLVTLLSGITKCRPYLPQPPVFPVIRYQLISVTRENSVDGTSTGATEAGIQVDCMADSYAGAKALADSVRAVLHGHIGAWGTLTAQFVNLQTENDFNEINGDRATYWVSQRYQVWTNMS